MRYGLLNRPKNSLSINGILLLSVFSVLLLLLSSGELYYFLMPKAAFATSVSATVDPHTNLGNITYSTIRSIVIKYDPESPIAKQANGVNQTISFVKDDSDYTMNQFASILNHHLAQQKNTPGRITNITRVVYLSNFIANETTALLTIKLDFSVSVNNTILVLAKNDTNSITNPPEGQSSSQKIPMAAPNTTTIAVDARWRDISISEPVYLETQQYAGININSPMEVFQMVEPTLAGKFASADSPAASIFNKPLLNFSDIGNMPLEKWSYSENQGNIVYSVAKGPSAQVPNNVETARVDGTTTTVINGTNVVVVSKTNLPSAEISITNPNQKILVAPEFPSTPLVVIVSISTVMVVAIAYTNKSRLSFSW